MDIKTVDDEIMLSDGRILKIPVIQKSLEEKESKKVKFDKIQKVAGSSAGAGSDYFEVYRKQRNEENERIEIMEQKWKEYNANKTFQEERKAQIEKMQKKSLKRKKKRLMKKEKKKKLKEAKKTIIKNTNLDKGDSDMNNNSSGNASETITHDHGIKEDKENINKQTKNHALQSDHYQLPYNNRKQSGMILSDEEEEEKEEEQPEQNKTLKNKTQNFIVLKEDELI